MNFSSTKLLPEKEVGYKHHLYFFPANVSCVKDNTMLSACFYSSLGHEEDDEDF